MHSSGDERDDLAMERGRALTVNHASRYEDPDLVASPMTNNHILETP
jgi:hypothetical protein